MSCSPSHTCPVVQNVQGWPLSSCSDCQWTCRKVRQPCWLPCWGQTVRLIQLKPSAVGRILYLHRNSIWMYAIMDACSRPTQCFICTLSASSICTLTSSQSNIKGILWIISFILMFILHVQHATSSVHSRLTWRLGPEGSIDDNVNHVS